MERYIRDDIPKYQFEKTFRVAPGRFQQFSVYWASCSAMRSRSINLAICVPSAVSIESKSSSGAWIPRLKNSITPVTSPMPS